MMVPAAPGMGLLRGVAGISLSDGSVVAPPTGSGPLMSTNTDGLHFDSCTGQLAIDRCSTSASLMGDDAINVRLRCVLPARAPARVDLQEASLSGGSQGSELYRRLKPYWSRCGC